MYDDVMSPEYVVESEPRSIKGGPAQYYQGVPNKAAGELITV